MSTTPGFQADILRDSISADRGIRLTTMVVTYPRFIHAELLTHRAFSRNSASSRAIPITKMLHMVRNHPAEPIVWQANQPGMQGGAKLEGADLLRAKELWHQTHQLTVIQIENYLNQPNGVTAHKQIINRLLEPFLWHTTIVSSTEWSNFFALRTDKRAQPELRHLALLMQAALDRSKPALTRVQEWHTPFVDRSEVLDLNHRLKVSAARCARVSYLTHDGRRDIQKDLDLYERLTAEVPRHASPLEHVATPVPPNMARMPDTGNFRGWIQLRKFLPDECQ